MNLFSSAFVGVNVGKKTATNYSDLKTLDKEQEISAMCWATEEEQTVRIIQTKQDIFFLNFFKLVECFVFERARSQGIFLQGIL